MPAIRVLICNHHPIVRSGLRLLLERTAGIRVVGEAADGREAVVLTEYCRPDVVLLDVKLAGTNGIAIAREISAKVREAAIVFVTAETDEEYIAEATRAGARGYVLAESVQRDLVRAIQLVREGGRFFERSSSIPG